MAQNYILLETIELTQSAASVTFDNLPPSGYTDLKVVASFRGTTAALYEITAIRFNGLSTNLSSKSIEGNGSAASSISNSFIYFGSGDGASATANTFSNIEAYIPNYTSSNYKSVSINSVGETNGTTIYSQLTAGLWSSIAAITSVEIVPTGNFVANSTFSLYGVAADGTTPVTGPKASGGNIVANDGTYWYHAFLSSGTFTPATELSCDYLVVAGGASGGCRYGGGGGAGGLRSTVGTTGGGGSLESLISVTAQNYPITIGAGGASLVGVALRGNNGSNSTFSIITSIGGGGGGTAVTFNDGIAGGSGGGGIYQGIGGAGTANQGFAGGAGKNPNKYPQGGGGGAGAVGQTPASSTSNSGAGGAGVQITALSTPTLTGVSGYYAGGGGGGGSTDGGVAAPGAGGIGGGGSGGVVSGANGVAGVANTGSGGGGGWGEGTNASGAGGSGIVIIRYAMA
tara:strand:+ start:1887 stop:3257 length:1371 start_codon:yes stop_codon:yes gene_type:complete